MKALMSNGTIYHSDKTGVELYAKQHSLTWEDVTENPNYLSDEPDDSLEALKEDDENSIFIEQIAENDLDGEL